MFLFIEQALKMLFKPLPIKICNAYLVFTKSSLKNSIPNEHTKKTQNHKTI